MYAKLINNTLRRAPDKASCNGNTVFNPPPEILVNLGYLPVTYTVPPGNPPPQPASTMRVPGARQIQKLCRSGAW